MPWGENKGVANLDGIYTDVFYSLKARNLWGKSLMKIWPEARNNSIQLASITIIFKENPKQNALEFLAFGRGFLGIALRLDI